jgi:heat shock protein HslJ
VNARRRSTQLLALAALVAVAGFAGCSPDDEDTRAATAGLPDLEQRLEAEQWALDADESTVDGPLPPDATLVFADGLVSGVAACNSFRAPFSAEDDANLEVGRVAATLQACVSVGDDEAGPDLVDDPSPAAGRGVLDEATERALFAALEGAHEVDSSDPQRLVLEQGGTELVFRAVDAEEQLTGTWEVVNVATGDAVTGLPADALPVVAFERDGGVQVDAGCGAAAGRWSATGRTLDVFSLDSRPECPPEVPDELHHAVLAALDGAHTIDLSGSSLVVLDEDGHILLVATRAR